VKVFVDFPGATFKLVDFQNVEGKMRESIN
jgi:hypothetical protein